MRYVNKVISIFLMIVLLIWVINLKNNNILAEDKDNRNNCINIKQESIIENDEFFKSDIKYPTLQIDKICEEKNRPKEEIINKINTNIHNYIVNFEKSIKEEAQQYKEDYKKIYSKSNNAYVKYQYEAYSNYEVAYNKNNIISIPITTYEFTGGAHGMTYLKSYNYNLIDSKELTLSDIFRDGVDYKKIVNSFIKKEIDKNQGDYFDNIIGEFKGISENQEFYIEEDGVVIYFPLYEIAPYSTGIPKFKLDNKDFSMYYKENIFK